MFKPTKLAWVVGTILGLFLCGPVGYILAMVYGWQNKVAWKLEKVMPIFIGSFVLGLLLFIPGYGLLIASMAGDIQNQMQMQQNQIQMQMDQDPMPDMPQIQMPPINMPQPAPQQ